MVTNSYWEHKKEQFYFLCTSACERKKEDWKKGNLSLSLQSLQLTGSATFPIWVKIFDFNANSAFFFGFYLGFYGMRLQLFQFFTKNVCTSKFDDECDRQFCVTTKTAISYNIHNSQFVNLFDDSNDL